ncbi:MAG: SNF2 helicase associated domain-containing protein, partial [Lachnospiraceae bacterium]|nr:SNF2 helicase associated domain-containing protein [Lachnospiraceae bacterium]
MRGTQLYRSGAVRNVQIQRSTGLIRCSVLDNFEYTVTMGEDEEKGLTYTCNCAEAAKEKGACRHVIAGFLSILKHQEKEKMGKLANPEDRRACACLDFFRGQEDMVCPMEIYHIEPEITVPQILGSAEGNAFLSLKCGHDRLYKIQNIKRFVLDYIGKQDIILGKEFKFIYYESEFDKSSQEILDFIIEVLEILGMDEDSSTIKVFERSRMMLTQTLLLKLLKIVGKYSFTLKLYDNTYENVRVFNQNPNIKYDLDIVDDAIVLDYRDKEAVIPLAKTGDLIYYNGAVFMPDARFKRNYAPFFNNLGPDKPALIFRGENKQRFLEEVLPKIGDSMDIEIPEELQDRYIAPELKCSIYFDRYVNSIKAEVHFIYGDFEFNSFENPKSDYYIITRDKNKEGELTDLLEKRGFEARSGFYLLKSESGIYDFLTGDISDLSAEAELYYSDEFRKLRVVSGSGFNIGLRVSSDMDLLEMDFNYADMDADELQSLFRSLRVRKKYYRMQDGSFINLQDDGFEHLMNILDNLGVSSKNIGR